MKKLSYLLFLLTFLQSCATVVPLKGKYQEKSVKTEINKPFDAVWESIIDFVAEAGVSINLIDKSSGLIVADEVSFARHNSFEKRKGDIHDPSAYTVSERTNGDQPDQGNKYNVTGKWNMRAVASGNGKTVVSVNVYALSVDKSVLPLTAESTGNFEKWILDKIVSGVK
jgi:hypothetical protein